LRYAARQQTGAVLRVSAQPGGELAFDFDAAGPAAACLSAVLRDHQLHGREVEDLATLGRDDPRFSERRAAAGAPLGCVRDDVVGVL
jgi:hypothetical protein